MEIEITVYKGTGKYYTSGKASHDEEIPLWNDKFDEFVANNLPAFVSGGYVTVDDVDDACKGFHCHLYLYDELIKHRTKPMNS